VSGPHIGQVFKHRAGDQFTVTRTADAQGCVRGKLCTTTGAPNPAYDINGRDLLSEHGGWRLVDGPGSDVAPDAHPVTIGSVWTNGAGYVRTLFIVRDLTDDDYARGEVYREDAPESAAPSTTTLTNLRSRRKLVTDTVSRGQTWWHDGRKFVVDSVLRGIADGTFIDRNGSTLTGPVPTTTLQASWLCLSQGEPDARSQPDRDVNWCALASDEDFNTGVAAMLDAGTATNAPVPFLLAVIKRLCSRGTGVGGVSDMRNTYAAWLKARRAIAEAPHNEPQEVFNGRCKAASDAWEAYSAACRKGALS